MSYLMKWLQSVLTSLRTGGVGPMTIASLLIGIHIWLARSWLTNTAVTATCYKKVDMTKEQTKLPIMEAFYTIQGGALLRHSGLFYKIRRLRCRLRLVRCKRFLGCKPMAITNYEEIVDSAKSNRGKLRYYRENPFMYDLTELTERLD